MTLAENAGMCAISIGKASIDFTPGYSTALHIPTRALGHGRVVGADQRLDHVLGGEDRTDAADHPGDDLAPADAVPAEHAGRQLRLQRLDAAGLLERIGQRQDDAEVLDDGVGKVGVHDRAHAAQADVDHGGRAHQQDRQRLVDVQDGGQHGAPAGIQGDGDDAECDDGQHGRRVAHRLAVGLGQDAGDRVLPAFLVFPDEDEAQQQEAEGQRHQVPGGGDAQFKALLGGADADGAADEFRQQQGADQVGGEVASTRRHAFAAVGMLAHAVGDI
jgi:hypothetical protein